MIFENWFLIDAISLGDLQWLAHIFAQQLISGGVTPGLPHRRGPATLPVFDEPPSENKDEAERESLN